MALATFHLVECWKGSLESLTHVLLHQSHSDLGAYSDCAIPWEIESVDPRAGHTPLSQCTRLRTLVFSIAPEASCGSVAKYLKTGPPPALESITVIWPGLGEAAHRAALIENDTLRADRKELQKALLNPAYAECIRIIFVVPDLKRNIVSAASRLLLRLFSLLHELGSLDFSFPLCASSASQCPRYALHGADNEHVTGSGKPEIGHAKRVAALAVSRDGTRAASSDGDMLVLWDTGKGSAPPSIVAQWPWPLARPQLAFSPDGTRLLTTGNPDRVIDFWDAGVPVRTDGSGYSGMDPPDLLASISATKSREFSPDKTGRALCVLEWHDASDTLVAADARGALWVWDALTGAQRRTFAPAQDARRDVARGAGAQSREDCTAVVLSPEGRYIAVLAGYAPRHGTVWDTVTYALHAPFSAPEPGRLLPRALAFDAPLRALVAVTYGGLVLRWSVESGEVVGREDLREPSGVAIARLARGGRRVFWTNRAERDVLSVLDVGPEAEAGGSEHSARRIRHRGEINWIAVSPDGEHVATSSDERAMCLWRVSDGECVAEDRRPGALFAVQAGRFSEDGGMFVNGSTNGTVEFFAATTR